MALKGTIAKKEITDKILATFEGSFLYNDGKEIRIPFVPGYNDGEIIEIATFLKTLKNLTGVRILPYHNYASTKYDSLDMENTLPARVPDDAEIEKAKDIIASMGLKVLN